MAKHPGMFCCGLQLKDQRPVINYERIVAKRDPTGVSTETPTHETAQVFSCEYCDISKNSFIIEQLQRLLKNQIPYRKKKSRDKISSIKKIVSNRLMSN